MTRSSPVILIVEDEFLLRMDSAEVIENAGFEVRSAELYDRPTPLDGDNGMADWIRQFKWFYFEALPAGQRTKALQDTVEDLAPILHKSGQWIADYRRLRLIAVRL